MTTKVQKHILQTVTSLHQPQKITLKNQHFVPCQLGYEEKGNYRMFPDAIYIWNFSNPLPQPSIFSIYLILNYYFYFFYFSVEKANH